MANENAISEIDSGIVTITVNKLSSLLTESLRNKIQETGKTEINLRIQINTMSANPMLIWSIHKDKLEGEIGLWLGSKTMDITVFDKTGDSLYEFHDAVADLEDVEKQLQKIVNLFTGS